MPYKNPNSERARANHRRTDKVYADRHREEVRDKQRVSSRTYRELHPDRVRASIYKWRAAHRAKFNAYQLVLRRKRLYGITTKEYEDLFLSQGSRCAICRCSEPGGKKCWHIDHDHSTNKVRGILCHSCNLLLGQAKDSLDTLHSAIAYLAKGRD